MTALETRILELLDTQQWQSRKELAALLNRKNGKTSPSDNAILDRLETKGLIEIRQRVIGAVKTRYEYRKV